MIDYKKTPDKKLKSKITKQFHEFCKRKTDYQTLNLVLKRMLKNKNEFQLTGCEKDDDPNKKIHGCDI